MLYDQALNKLRAQPAIYTKEPLIEWNVYYVNKQLCSRNEGAFYIFLKLTTEVIVQFVILISGCVSLAFHLLL